MTHLCRNKDSGHGAAGFSLVEVALACGIAAFCLITVFGLLPLGLKVNRASVEQTAASGILSTVAADLRATPSTTPLGQTATSPQFSIPFPANPVTTSPSATTLYFDGSGTSSTSLVSDSRYLLTATFLPNGSNARMATLVSLQVSWPAAATVANAEGSVTTFLALDRN